MSASLAIDLIRRAVELALLVSAPLLVTALLVGIAVSLIQAVTQIQEQTLTFIPKLLLLALVFVLTLPWMVSQLIDYLTGVTRWRKSTKDAGRATILIEPDQILCMKNGFVDCFAPDGRLLWHQPLDGQGLGRGALGYPGNVAQADDPGTR